MAFLIVQRLILTKDHVWKLFVVHGYQIMKKIVMIDMIWVEKMSSCVQID